jgi:hypothetical protein
MSVERGGPSDARRPHARAPMPHWCVVVGGAPRGDEQDKSRRIHDLICHLEREIVLGPTLVTEPVPTQIIGR